MLVSGLPLHSPYAKENRIDNHRHSDIWPIPYKLKKVNVTHFYNRQQSEKPRKFERERNYAKENDLALLGGSSSWGLGFLEDLVSRICKYVLCSS